MFGNIGGGELLLIFVIALLVFGSKRLPEIGSAVGKGLTAFKRGLNDLSDETTSSQASSGLRSLDGSSGTGSDAGRGEPKKLSQ